MSLPRAYVLDDEPLAVRRLERLLAETGRVALVGSSSDPEQAAVELASLAPDLLFLDIQMPGLSGFDLLRRLDPQPLVVFTTAHHQYALKAFEVNSIDYLLKPIEAAHLGRALAKVERIRGGSEPKPEVDRLLRQMAEALQARPPEYPERIASRLGDKVEFVDLSRVTHFYAQDKLTYAATPEKPYCVDLTIQELDERLDPRQWLRIHRSTLVRLSRVHELYAYFGGRMLVRLNDAARTELTVARDRVKALKDRLGV